MAEAAYGGTYGGSYRLKLEINTIAQSEDSNNSTVSILAYMHRISSSGGDIFNNNPTSWSVNVDGQGYGGTIVYGHLGNGGTVTMLNTTKVIGHNSDGTKSFSYSASHNASNSPYITSASLSGSQGLGSLYLWAAPTLVEASAITDVGFNWRTVTNRTVDNIAISLDGGAWNYFAGDTTDRTVSLGGASNPLISGKSYSVRVSLRRKSSGYWQEHGNWTVTTEAQNKMFDLGDY